MVFRFLKEFIEQVDFELGLKLEIICKNLTELWPFFHILEIQVSSPELKAQG